MRWHLPVDYHLRWPVVPLCSQQTAGIPSAIPVSSQHSQRTLQTVGISPGNARQLTTLNEHHRLCREWEFHQTCPMRWSSTNTARRSSNITILQLSFTMRVGGQYQPTILRTPIGRQPVTVRLSLSMSMSKDNNCETICSHIHRWNEPVNCLHIKNRKRQLYRTRDNTHIYNRPCEWFSFAGCQLYFHARRTPSTVVCLDYVVYWQSTIFSAHRAHRHQSLWLHLLTC